MQISNQYSAFNPIGVAVNAETGKVTSHNWSLEHLSGQANNLIQRIDNNTGVSVNKGADSTTFSIGGQGSLMDAFFNGQLDGGGTRSPEDPGSRYDTGVLSNQNQQLKDILQSGTLSNKQQDMVKLQLQLNEAITSSDTNNDGKVTISEWQSYIKDNADANGKLNFTV